MAKDPAASYAPGDDWKDKEPTLRGFWRKANAVDRALLVFGVLCGIAGALLLSWMATRHAL